MKERKVYVASGLRDVKANWFWEPYIPSGKITMLHGTEGIGKTSLGIRLMSACTGRVKMDRFGSDVESGRCLYLTKVENLAEIVKPKLKNADVNLDEILIINDRSPITLADESLRSIIIQNQIRLMLIDPLSSYLERTEALYENPEEVFPIIKKLDLLASDTGCTIVLIEESDGLSCELAKLWRNTFGRFVSSYLCLTWEDDLSFIERILYHETSFLSLEGNPVNYKLSTKGLKCI